MNLLQNSSLQRGFSLIELTFLLGLIGILSGIALPFYKDYIERAHLAEVITEYDAIREQAQIAAMENNRDLCNWQVTMDKQVPDAGTAAIMSLVNTGLKSLDPKRWQPKVNHLTSDLNVGKPAALTIQFGGIGAAGVARTRLLAAEFQKMGAFNRWERQSAPVSTFTVFLGSCKAGNAGAALVSSAVTQSATLTSTASLPKCSPVQELSADRSSCVAKVCSKGLVLDTVSGACNPGCKPEEYPPLLRFRGGFGEGFDQPRSGPHVCFSLTTEACPADKPVAGIDDKGVRSCHPMFDPERAYASAPKPTGCAVHGNRDPIFTDGNRAALLPYKAVTCGDNTPDLCEFMTAGRDATTCPAGSFPSVTVNNTAGGTRETVRACMPAAQCKQDYWEQSSQIEDCQTLDTSKTSTKVFSCTYCCAGNNCNGFDIDASGSKSDTGVCPVNPNALLRW